MWQDVLQEHLVNQLCGARLLLLWFQLVLPLEVKPVHVFMLKVITLKVLWFDIVSNPANLSVHDEEEQSTDQQVEEVRIVFHARTEDLVISKVFKLKRNLRWYWHFFSVIIIIYLEDVLPVAVAQGSRDYQTIHDDAHQRGKNFQQMMNSVKKGSPTFEAGFVLWNSECFLPEEQENDHEGKGASVCVVLKIYFVW